MLYQFACIIIHYQLMQRYGNDCCVGEKTTWGKTVRQFMPKAKQNCLTVYSFGATNISGVPPQLCNPNPLVKKTCI
jgi:hypothetical protein